MLAIRSLTLHHFRNYAFAELSAPASVVLTGPNGAGKTNLLEALSLLSPGRGMRKARLNHMMHQSSDSEPWVVAAQVDGLQGEVQLGTALDLESGRERRIVKRDGEPLRSQSALAEDISLSWHTPQMDGLFLSSDGDRRRYLDRLIFSFDAQHLVRVSRYEHAMRERNRLLAESGSNAPWLTALEHTMAYEGVAIAAARREGLTRLNHAVQKTEHAFAPAKMWLECPIAQALEQEQPAADIEMQCQTQLEVSRPRDKAAGRALTGAHRSCWHVQHAAKQMPAAHCSTGEQKALLLSIILAHAHARKDWLGAAPILLLDETVAHLDAARRAALANAVQELGGQVWMTGTDAADFEAFLPFSRSFQVQAGQIWQKCG